MKIAILASGRGSNFEAIARATLEGKIQAEVVALIVDRRKIGAVERAEKLGVNYIFVDPYSFPSREEYNLKLIAILKHLEVDLICLAGYKKVLSPVFVKEFKLKIMNIHPTLLPSFPGLGAHRKVLNYGVKITGATVHFVDEGVDTGPIIIQGAVPVEPDDSEETLAERVLAVEHRIYPQAVKWFIEGRLKVEGRKVIVEGGNYSSLPIVPALEDF